MATLRPMVPGDYPVAAQMSNEAARHALVGRPTWETAAEVAATLAQRRPSEFIVAEDDEGQIRGLAGYQLADDGGALVHGPLVARMGQGTGALLASRIEAMARARGATSYAMLLGLENGQGTAWAEWRGYQRDTEYPETLLAWVYPGELRRPAEPAGVMVRRAASGDLDAVEGLYRQCYQVDSATRVDWQGWLPATWVAEAGGDVVGLVQLDPVSSSIQHLCVSPGARRRGLGGWLVAEAVAAYWRQTPAKVGVAVPLDNHSGVAMIRRLGFRREIPVTRWMKRS